jgi:hypothetical protein
MGVDHSWSRTRKTRDRKARATGYGNKDTKGMFRSLGLIARLRGNFFAVD